MLSYLHSWSWFKTVCLRICKDIYYIMDLYYDNYLFVSYNIIWGPFNTLPSKVGSGQKKGLIQKIMKYTNFIGTNNKGISSIKINFIYPNYFVITSCSKMLQKYAMPFIHKEIKILFCSFESGRSASKLVHFFFS